MDYNAMIQALQGGGGGAVSDADMRLLRAGPGAASDADEMRLRRAEPGAGMASDADIEMMRAKRAPPAAPPHDFDALIRMLNQLGGAR